jgi:hypothetical protein
VTGEKILFVHSWQKKIWLGATAYSGKESIIFASEGSDRGKKKESG